MVLRIFNDSGLANKAVIVTGGSRGIGRAIVELFAAEGADVTFLFLQDTESAQQVVTSAATAGMKVAAEKGDVRDPQSCENLVEKIAERTGRIDVLVNNSGIVRDNVLGLLSDDEIRDVLDTNVIGAFNMTRAAIPHMISRRAGKIINVSSVAGEKGGRGQTNYAASKGAINALTRALAAEVAPRNITVNAVAPGVIETEMSETVRERAEDQVKSKILLRRFGSVNDVAGAVVFLASRHADYITGHILNVDGGFKME
jgi:3-oxoacyl-[acyl-carrier protein] reductase